jgi:hypothetical protein
MRVIGVKCGVCRAWWVARGRPSASEVRRVGSVAELGGQPLALFLVGGEVRAGFADRLVAAVQDGERDAVPVAEQLGGFAA